MIIPDTSIWADHFREAVDQLAMLLTQDRILQHPFVTGELALGNPRNRKAMVALLNAIPAITARTHTDVMTFIESEKLGGTGIGYVDAHLLASTVAIEGAVLWSRDKRLIAQAERMGVRYTA